MKHIKLVIMFLMCSMSLVGSEAWSSCCHHHSHGMSHSHTMRNADVGTLAGALTGGLLGSTIGHGGGRFFAIAAGSIAGAAMGSAIGRNMDRTDHMKMYSALEYNPVGRPAYWHNDHTGARYEVVPVRNVMIEDHEYCREYRTIAMIGGKKRELYGTACREPDGAWRAVN